MKRTWENFRLDKNKVYQFIGQAVVYISFNLLLAGIMVFGFLQNTIY